MANTQLADLDELVLHCRDEKAKSYIAEAVACYKVGAYRQSIVATWIAIAYDIIHKLQELDLTGDKKARKKLEEYEKIWEDGDIKKALDFERQILDMARGDFELLSALEYTDLTRIRDDRNRCAHPSLNTIEEIYQPSPELARTHIRNAVTHLLQRPPVQGKAALDRLVRDVNSEYFPIDDEEEAKTYFMTGPLSRPRETLVRNFGLILIKTFLYEELDIKGQNRFIVAIIALRELHKEFVEDIFAGRLNDLFMGIADEHVIKCLYFLFQIEDTWQYLAEDMRIRLKNYVHDMPDEDLEDGLLYALEIPGLYESAKDRLSKLTAPQLTDLMRSDYLDYRSEFINLAVEKYTEAGNFDRANSIALNLVIPSAKHFTPDQIEHIVQAARENDQILYSYERSRVFNALRKSEIISEDAFNELLTRFGFEDEIPDDDEEWEDD